MPSKKPDKALDVEAPPPKVFGKTEQEVQCEALFADLEKLFKKLDKLTKPDKVLASLKDVNTKLKEAKALIKEFEREARADGMPANELADRRKELADQVNTYINRKKQYSAGQEAKGELLQGAQVQAAEDFEGMSTQQLMQRGRKDIGEIDATLNRAERLANDTQAVGVAVAGTLHDQTKQLEKIVDDLNEIEFSMKKASKIIGDITRGLLTDKCIAFLLFLVAAGVVVIIVLKIINPKKKEIAQAIDNTNITDKVNDAVNNAVNDALNGRRLLTHTLNLLLLEEDF